MTESMPQSIPPTVGRVVLYTPREGETINFCMPLAAQIATVNIDGTINIGVLDRDGNHHARQSVILLQDGDAQPEEGGYASWMSYQIGQAKKYDEPVAIELDSEEQGTEKDKPE